MLEHALKVIEEISSHGFKAYLVGGFVRDYILNIQSSDIDITTNATPQNIREMFQEECLPGEDYGSVTVVKRGIRYEITTFRKEIGYADHRKPVEIKYIDDLYQDLLRRDFTINAICMNQNGEIIDYLGGQRDIHNKKITSIGDASMKFEEDALRILRAIRFAAVLGFQLDEEVVHAIHKHKGLLKELSYYRKKSELDKMFGSSHVEDAIDLLLKFGLDKELELSNLEKVHHTNSLIGVWSILNVTEKYPFTNNEKELIQSINEVLPLNNLDPMALYKYGLYVNSVAAEIKEVDIKDVTESYNNLVIKSRSDLEITSDEIMELLDREPGSYLTEVYQDIEKEVLYRRLENDKDSLSRYIVEHYK